MTRGDEAADDAVGPAAEVASAGTENAAEEEGEGDGDDGDAQV